MANHVLLDNINHKDLKIITQRSADYGDNIASVLTFPFEFRDIQTHFPICFCKDPDTGLFYTAALLGFEEEENLFLDGDNWDASYVPLMLERQPFLIGQPQQGRTAGSAEDEQRLIHIDMDSPRISDSDGEAVFLEQGGSSLYLQRISSILEAIYQGREQSRVFIELLLNYELIEEFTLDVELNDGSKHQLQGFYTIAEDRLKQLPEASIAELFRAGYLQAIYMVIASFANFRSLIKRKNQRLC